MGLIFFQGIICPSNSPELLNGNSNTASSPFTIAFTAGGWTWSTDFINAIIVVAFISAINGCVYVQSRALYSLALSGRAPKVFAITSKKGGEQNPFQPLILRPCYYYLCGSVKKVKGHKTKTKKKKKN